MAAAKVTQGAPSIPTSTGKPSWQHPACSPVSSAPRTHCLRQHPPAARAPFPPPDHTVLAVLAFQTSQRFRCPEIIFTASRRLRQCQIGLNATLPRGERSGQTGWAGRQQPAAEPPDPPAPHTPHGHAAPPAPAACHAAHRRPGRLHRGWCRSAAHPGQGAGSGAGASEPPASPGGAPEGSEEGAPERHP